jgi:hypothetical protein
MLREDITFYCREEDPSPGNTISVDQLCYCEETCNDADIQYSSPLPGLINSNNLLLSCDVALQQTVLVINAVEPRRCPVPLEVRVSGY